MIVAMPRHVIKAYNQMCFSIGVRWPAYDWFVIDRLFRLILLLTFLFMETNWIFIELIYSFILRTCFAFQRNCKLLIHLGFKFHSLAKNKYYSREKHFSCILGSDIAYTFFYRLTHKTPTKHLRHSFIYLLKTCMLLMSGINKLMKWEASPDKLVEMEIYESFYC
jgi:hypothetical protein